MLAIVCEVTAVTQPQAMVEQAGRMLRNGANNQCGFDFARIVEAAVRLAGTIHDDRKREPLLKAALLSWGTSDRERMLRYVATSPMTESKRRDLMAALDHYSDFGFH